MINLYTNTRDSEKNVEIFALLAKSKKEYTNPVDTDTANPWVYPLAEVDGFFMDYKTLKDYLKGVINGNAK
jgi:hypothetical protein